MIARPQHVWVDPTARWGVDTARPGLLAWWERMENGSWWAFVGWAEVGARAHGGSPRWKVGWMPAGCVRKVDGPKPPLDVSWVKPVNGVPT
ncbi:hypothetical protein INN71_02855 [Nocardioides sp. ChNu-153]|uniref:hypothetical protein n=1 Tax=Nocardioides sp. ChNu-153 TaxID=2779364 RepID=UPI002650DE7E|nr:hypothetical protein [Nocardioides sp. ChNu-153]MDN7120326.1 hypothetical protein [Nocardioides sp. ChNu-153]